MLLLLLLYINVKLLSMLQFKVKLLHIKFYSNIIIVHSAQPTLPFLKMYVEKDLSNQQLWPLPWSIYRQKVSRSSDSSWYLKTHRTLNILNILNSVSCFQNAWEKESIQALFMEMIYSLKIVSHHRLTTCSTVQALHDQTIPLVLKSCLLKRIRFDKFEKVQD